jgi:hypothetical protein
MSQFNRVVTTAVASPVMSEPVAARTFEGAQAYGRDAKSELFLLAVSLMGVRDDAFYEKARDRDERYTSLVRSVAIEDPEWIAKLVPWLRNGAQMRTASVVAGAEAAKALLDAGKPGARRVIASALGRADEPGELIAYWRSRYGRRLPVAVNRGIADAVKRLYTEFSLLKWDSREASVRFGDVVELVNPRYHLKEYGTWRDALYRYAIEVRHGRGNEVPESLPMIRANAALRARAAGDPSVLLDTATLRAAGMTWEDALSLAGRRADKARLWSAMAPLMSLMALARNLRNMDEAGVPDSVAQAAAARLADPEQVRKSRQFPFRFLAAYRAAPSLRWAWPLEQALNASLASVPALTGRTLVLVDRSPSMWMQKFSDKSDMPWADAAAVFGAAIALRAEYADLAEFGIPNAPVKFSRGESVLKVVERFRQYSGTDIPSAVRRYFRDGFHSRVVIVTDEQTRPGYLPSNASGWKVEETPVDALIPASVPVFIWNFGGYKHGAMPSGLGTRHILGGLTDSAFRLIPMIEAGRDARWDDLFAPAAD